jgi:hypothetical protein
MVRKLLAKPAALLLILLMAAGSIAMWLAVPVGWLYLGSRISRGSGPSLGPYLLVLAGIVVSMAVIGKLLARLDRAYAAVTGAGGRRERRQLPWNRSLRGERGSGHRRTILDSVMIVSVSIALIAFCVWVFGFAGSSLPS